VRDADGATLVYVLDARESSVHARRVETGAARADAVEIASGLRPGEPVVVAGQQRVRDGSRVLVLPFAHTAESRAEREDGAP
jgi:multidrug efflux pump subunit AcrA (membrane-fusion protein)